MEAIRKDNLPLAGGYGGRLCGLELLQPLLHDKLSHSGDKANTQRRVRHRSRLPMIPWILYQTVVVEVLVIQSCFTLCNPMDCSLPGSFAHGILQERILEWVAMPSSRGSPQPRDWILVSHTAGRYFTIWATCWATIQNSTGLFKLWVIMPAFLKLNWIEIPVVYNPRFLADILSIIYHISLIIMGFPGGASGKEPACQCRRFKRLRFNPWIGKTPWRRAQQSTPVFLPGEFLRQNSLSEQQSRV